MLLGILSSPSLRWTIQFSFSVAKRSVLVEVLEGGGGGGAYSSCFTVSWGGGGGVDPPCHDYI